MRLLGRMFFPLLLAALSAGAAETPTAIPADEPILGSWAGSERLGADSKPIAIHFELYKKNDNALVMYYDSPQMKFDHLGPMPVQREGDTYKNAYFRLTLAPDRATLSGSKSFDGHDLQVDLKRGNLPPVRPQVSEASPVAKPVWVFETDAPIWSSPVVADGMVYFGSNDKNVYALEAKSGSFQWSFATGAAVMGRPTVDGDNLYTLSDDGYLYQLDRRNGKPHWKFDTHGTGVARDLPGATSTNYDYQTSAASVADGIVYIGSADKKVYAIDARSGKERWHFDTQGMVRSIPAVADGRVFFGSYDHFVYALDAKTGALVWKHDTLEPVVSAPLVDGGTVYIGSRSSDLFAFDAASGKVRWSFFFWSSWVESSARLHSGTLYIGSSDYQQVFAIDASSGREQWRFASDGSPWSSPAVTEQRVYIGVVGVTPYFIDHHGGFFALDRATGKALWHFPMKPIAGATDYGVASSPAVDGGLVFFGGLDGNFHAFRAD